MNSSKDKIYTELLLIKYRRGDNSALEKLTSFWEQKLFYYISRLVDNEEDAWDALQDTWLALIKNISKVREPKSFVMWLYRTARNNAMNKLRLRYSDKKFLEENEVLIKTDDDTETFNFEDAQQVHLAMSRLSLNHREVLTLYFLEDLSIEEISGVLTAAPGTIKSRLHYAKCALRRILEEGLE